MSYYLLPGESEFSGVEVEKTTPNERTDCTNSARKEGIRSLSSKKHDSFSSCTENRSVNGPFITETDPLCPSGKWQESGMDGSIHPGYCRRWLTFSLLW